MSILSSRTQPAHDAAESKNSQHQSGYLISFGATTATALLTTALLAPALAHAADGCLVLLCFAAPSWKSIPQCVPPIREVLHDLARGKAFPTCGMSGAGSSAAHKWARAPGNCPPQYTRIHETERGKLYRCEYNGVVTVTIDGKQFTRTWWDMGGDTVTDFSPAAKSQLGTWDTRYDDEQAEWLRSHP